MDELLLDLLPNDPGHLITVEFCDWVDDFDLFGWFGGESVGECGFCCGGKALGEHIKSYINLRQTAINFSSN